MPQIEAQTSIATTLGDLDHHGSETLARSSCDPKPSARQWNHHMSVEGSSRSNATLKSSARTTQPVISLGVARPTSDFYPWNKIDVQPTDSRCSGVDRRKDMDRNAFLYEDRWQNYALDLNIALNYCEAAGIPSVLQFITEHVKMIHNPPYRDWEVSLTCGTTSAIDLTLRLLCNRGDSILTEKYTYPGTIEAAKHLGVNIAGAKMDELGLIPQDIDQKLQFWNVSDQGPKPKLLYTIPCGQNPTGTTQPLHRRQAIYQVAEKYDLIILEDDPYYFIRLVEAQDSLRKDDLSPAPVFQRSSGSQARSDYITALPPSYLSLDTSGRVIRLDSTSKILAPGLRCGWITGCSQLIQKFLSHTEVSMVSPNGLSQLVMYNLLAGTWDHDGLNDWLRGLSLRYSRRASALIKACTEFLPLEMCRWMCPTAGMFLWIIIDPAKCIDNAGSAPLNSGSYTDLEDRIYVKARKEGVLISKGTWFRAEKQQFKNQRDVRFRLTFAAATEECFAPAARILGRVIREEFAMQR